MTVEFTHVTLGQRVLFGAGLAREGLAGELARLGARRPLILAGDRERAMAEQVVGGLEESAGVERLSWHGDVAMHVPVDVAERARAAAAAAEADVVVAVGGGSTTGLAKAVALTTGLPIIAVPTTFAGSEATNVWGMTEDGRKTTGVDDAVLPASIVYDAELTASLPPAMAVASGLNALAHCVDSLWAPRADPINGALAAEGARALSAGLPLLHRDPDADAGREQVLYGAYLAAVAFASAGSGLHHKICHVLGGAYDLPHAETHAVVLPHVLAFNGPAAPAAQRRLAEAFGSDSAMSGLAALYDAVDAPSALADHGMAAADIPAAARLVAAVVPDSNPRPAAERQLVGLLTAAQNGDRAAWGL
ncbi:maleylacetate reductase [Tomitella gaofuii]|uniref:maleylacetate reductase n=1 Tax=Tomitella gaofuii TaxID=2760083 RepID=UPI0015FD6CB4|nr:maleylacetate reductase [Tomitella gaofuii]